MNMHQNFIEQLRKEVAKYEGRAGVPIEISNGFAEGLLDQIEAVWAVMHPVLTTAEELDALPTGSIIRDKSGQAWQKVADSYWHAALWKQGNSSADVAAHLCPAVVLYRP